MEDRVAETVKIGLLGAGGIVRAGHLPSLKRIPGVEVFAVADPAPGVAESLAQTASIPNVFTAAEPLLDIEGVDAVIIATPNDEHPRLAMAAAERGIHVLCEKPIGLNLAQAEAMLEAAEKAGTVHMTAFNYRFIPSMRWLAHRMAQGEIGTPHHFRSQRFQDMGDRALNWRQVKARCGSGELADMMAHRIDYSHMLIGRMTGLFGKVKNLLPERKTRDGQIQVSDVDDWAALIVVFENGCSGVFEATKVAPGYGSGLKSWDCVEINGPKGSFKFLLHEPTTLYYAAQGERYEAQPVPDEFLKMPGFPRDPHEGEPAQTFRWDQAWEFVSAIREGRQAVPSFREGVQTQKVLDAALKSSETGQWITL